MTQLEPQTGWLALALAMTVTSLSYSWSYMTDPMFDLTGKVALVTGGTRGLGRAMADAFAERGADLIVASRKADACESAAREITARFGVTALPAACNVSSWNDCDALIDRAYTSFGRVDVLVNNAGMSPLYPSLDQVSEALWDKVVAVNLKGPFRLTAVIGSRMAAGTGGSIINVSSVAAKQPGPRELPYAAAKAGLNALTQGFARAFGPTVRVNAIQAGPFLTDISKAWDLEAFAERARTSIALGRAGEPHEVIGAALYLASAASSFCTGAVLQLDGGVF
jgi:NAD(P)-dependent dehydrogenase (short-subunit alcohol dehydrogenase family)